MPVHDRVKEHARRQPQRIAVAIDDRALSWQQLWRGSQALYQHIRRQPPGGATIAIATGNAITFPLAWLAATARPFTAAIVDPAAPAAQLRDMLIRLAPGLLLLNQQDRALIDLAESLAIRWQAVDRWLQADPPAADDADFSTGMHDETPFLINFTSGTTSLPKAFVRSRRSWRRSFENGEAIFQLADAPSTLFPGPLSHGIGLYCLNETLYAGGSFHSLGQWRPDSALALIAGRQIQRLVVVPTMIAGFARAAGDAAAFPALQSLLSAGAKLELNHYRQARALFPAARMQEYYGASELGFIAVSTLDEDNISGSLTSVGRAFPGVTITIRDDDGAPLAANQPGQIFIQSEQIVERYLWGDDGSAFKKYPWGATVADIGYLDEQDRLYIIGRRGNMIVSGGNNIYLSEIETAIKTIPGIIEAVVIALDDDYYGKKIVAIIEAEFSVAATIPQLCRERLAKYKLPRDYYHLSRWPLTPSGKIKRAELEQRIANHDFRTDLTALPAGR